MNNVRRVEIGQERRTRMRQKLLEAAARVVADLGEKKATIDDFIQAAGVARGTFYNYYETRDELLADLWKEIGHDPFDEIQRRCHTIADPVERFAAQTRLVLQRTFEKPAWGWLVYALSVDGQSINEDLLSYPRPELIAGKHAGQFEFGDLASASDLVVGSVRMAMRALLSESRPPGYVRSFCVCLLRALGVDAARAQAIVDQPLPTDAG
ncbi:TetR/AcrR family transcriptional regulator [Cupriavidus sp. CP313]